jgi:hypothetical protein
MLSFLTNTYLSVLRTTLLNNIIIQYIYTMSFKGMHEMREQQQNNLVQTEWY